MLELGVEPDPAPGLGLLGLRQRHDLGEGRHLVEPVEAGIGGADRGQPLARAQRAHLGQREVLGEPAADQPPLDILAALAVGEFGPRGDIGGVGKLGLVPGDELEVPGRHQIGFDEIRALIDRALVSGERMLGPLARGAAVRDHQQRRGNGRGGRERGPDGGRNKEHGEDRAHGVRSRIAM